MFALKIFQWSFYSGFQISGLSLLRIYFNGAFVLDFSWSWVQQYNHSFADKDPTIKQNIQVLCHRGKSKWIVTERVYNSYQNFYKIYQSSFSLQAQYNFKNVFLFPDLSVATKIYSSSTIRGLSLPWIYFNGPFREDPFNVLPFPDLVVATKLYLSYI